MDEREPLLEPLVRRWIAPRACFAGAVSAFLACCLAGWLASGQPLYVNFVRLHPMIGPETSFRPTISQLRALVADTTPPGHVIVIVGGSSVLHGVGQARDTLWTRRLQERLGESFRVVNLALRAGGSAEGGALVAESFIKEGRPVIYVGDNPPGAELPTLGLPHEYLFWDAHYKGFLLEDAGRDTRIQQMIPMFVGAGRDALDERRLGGRLDSRLRFNDLWTTVGYRWAFTVWSRYTLGRPFAPRKSFAEPETGVSVPFEQRYLPSHLELSLRIARSFGQDRTALDPQGRWIADPDLPYWRAVRSHVAMDLPRSLQQRTVLVINGQSPYYLDMLTAEERLRYRLVVERTASLLREVGYETVAMDPDFTVDDYFDRVHLTPAGGARLAEAVAPVIRRLAERLGYLR